MFGVCFRARWVLLPKHNWAIMLTRWNRPHPNRLNGIGMLRLLHRIRLLLLYICWRMYKRYVFRRGETFVHIHQTFKPVTNLDWVADGATTFTFLKGLTRSNRISDPLCVCLTKCPRRLFSWRCRTVYSRLQRWLVHKQSRAGIIFFWQGFDRIVNNVVQCQVFLCFLGWFHLTFGYHSENVSFTEWLPGWIHL